MRVTFGTPVVTEASTPDGRAWRYDLERHCWVYVRYVPDDLPPPSRADPWWGRWLDERAQAVRAAYYPPGRELERYDPAVVSDVEYWDDDEAPAFNPARILGGALLVLAAILLLLAGNVTVTP